MRTLAVVGAILVHGAVAGDDDGAPAPPETQEEAPAPPSPEPSAPPAGSAAPAPSATCPSCCRVAVEVGPRIGVSVNGDQWLIGGQLRSSVPCLGQLGFGPTLAVGLGGNHLTLRSSGRLDYMLWFDRAHVFGVYPSAGVSVFIYTPVGRFAAFCHRVHLDECSGYMVGGEIGGGIRYRWAAVDAFLGLGGLPVVTIMAAASFPLASREGP
jgi:hypothetical protein